MKLFELRPRRRWPTRCVRWPGCCATRTPNCARSCPQLDAGAASRGRAPQASRLAELDALADRLCAAPACACEAEYVELFDRGRRTALHLFEHVHGDSRDRGQAMVDLAQTYERAGLLLAPGELPDYLPVVLEFASTQPPAAGARLPARDRAHRAHDLQCLAGALAARTPACWLPCSIWPANAPRRSPLAEEPAIDESWAEPAAFGGCTSNGQSRPNEVQPVHFVRSAKAARHATA